MQKGGKTPHLPYIMNKQIKYKSILVSLPVACKVLMQLTRLSEQKIWDARGYRKP